MTIDDQKLSTKSLAKIKNISYNMDILFTPIDINSIETKNSQIERKEKAYDYLKKYGVMTLRESLEDLKNVFSKIPVVDAK
jgi:hypothetical protein